MVKDDISGGNTGMQKRESIDYKIRGTYASLRKSEKRLQTMYWQMRWSAESEAMPLSQLFEVLFDSSVVVKYPIF